MQKSLLVALLLVLTACVTSPGGAGTPGSSEPVPYYTATPSATITPLPPLTEVYLPTPTPFTYTVRNGDTMSAIALRNNISLDALLAANPGVDPASLPIGTVLVIPVGSVVPGEPTPTPAALTVRQVRCWPESSGGLWCFGLVQNEYGVMVENLSAQFTLLDGSGNEIASQTAYGLLNILPASQAMPLTAHFPAPISDQVTPRLQVLTAILLQPGDPRYAPVAVQDILVQMDASGRTAWVTGQVVPLILDGQVNTIWILGVGYDFAGNVVGVRRWESATALAGGATLPFEFMIYSVGPSIERVEFIIEAQP